MKPKTAPPKAPPAGDVFRRAKARDDGDLAKLVAEFADHPHLRKLDEDGRWAAAVYYTSDVGFDSLRIHVGEEAARLIADFR